MSEAKASSLEAFASQLRAWRLRMGWTQVEAGEKLGYSASLVSGVETMDKNPTADFAKACDKGFGTPGFEEEPDAPGTFMTLQKLVAREAWPSYFAPVFDLEKSAIRIHQWDMRVVPGLLQTEDYARSVISAGRPRDSASSIDRAVSARLERQAILARDDPPMLWQVLHEGVLRHVVGSPAVMCGQLDKLASLAREPGIVVQVLPFAASDHPGTDGPVLIYDFEGKSSVAYTECNGGGRIVESPGEVADLTIVLNMIRAAALSPRESTALILEVRSEIADG
ncbi:MAG TPA: helix-turn-helix transcriptional regulator [Streptosporangiaceae bacterium]